MKDLRKDRKLTGAETIKVLRYGEYVGLTTLSLFVINYKLGVVLLALSPIIVPVIFGKFRRNEK